MMGSSAGAAVMSKLMISGDGNGTAYTRAGLGFLPNVVLDQHVVARHREWRLQQVISNNRHLIGLGIDEGAGVMFRGSECSVINGRVLLTQWNSGAISQARLKRGKTIRI